MANEYIIRYVDTTYTMLCLALTDIWYHNYILFYDVDISDDLIELLNTCTESNDTLFKNMCSHCNGGNKYIMLDTHSLLNIILEKGCIQ